MWHLVVVVSLQLSCGPVVSGDWTAVGQTMPFLKHPLLVPTQLSHSSVVQVVEMTEGSALMPI